MSAKIRNVHDLAAHLGADEDTSESIARRVYKDTACGCPCEVRTGQTGTESITYTVKVHISITGWRVNTWRRHGNLKQWAHKSPLPEGLADYLLVGKQGIGISPSLCAEGMERIEIAKEFGRDWMRELELDEQLIRKTRSGKLAYYLTLKIDEPTIGELFSVSGYCEGSDREHQERTVSFPCTPAEIDDAISAADEDGKQTWNETHGCQACWPEGYSDEHGNEWTVEDWVGQPINKDCENCKGNGVVI